MRWEYLGFESLGEKKKIKTTKPYIRRIKKNTRTDINEIENRKTIEKNQ